MERKDIVLNNGVTMPPIGYGVFRMTNLEECENAVVQTLLTKKQKKDSSIPLIVWGLIMWIYI